MPACIESERALSHLLKIIWLDNVEIMAKDFFSQHHQQF
jgi:hypothetical protein